MYIQKVEILMTLALIDGDVLAYTACKSRWEKKVQVIDNTNFIRLDTDGKRIPLDFTIEEDRQYMEESWENFKKDLNSLLTSLFTTDYLMAVKGDDNFRNLLYPEYKLNRHADPNKQNMFVPTIRQLAIHEGLAVGSDGCEADDLLRIWAEEARAIGQDYVICSVDKDLKCIPGKHWNIKKRELEEISELEAIRFYYTQLLKGDPTDNIPGVPRIGDVKAAKLLADVHTEDEFQEIVVDEYIKAYGDNWESYLLSNGKMIHLQKKPEDFFSISHWNIVKELR
jgi:5'-3' exonuclease